MDRFYIILIVIFCSVNGLGIAYSHFLQGLGVDNVAGMIGNILLAAVSALTYNFSYQGIQKKNQHLFARNLYISTFLKLLVCAIGVLIYAFIFRSSIKLSTIILFFLLYILYTAVETWSLMKAANSANQKVVNDGGSPHKNLE